jgi:hypothetical protein
MEEKMERYDGESVGSEEIWRVQSDKEGCINYEPGMPESEDELNAESESVFAEEFFMM